MKNNAKQLIINLSGGFLWFCAFFLLCIYAGATFKYGHVNVALCGVCGLVINYVLGLFFHELGHWIFAVCSGAKVKRVNFGLFTVIYNEENGKRKAKIKLFTFFGKNAGESDFYYGGKLTASKLSLWAFGGLLFSFIYLAALLVVVLCVKNPVLFCLFGAGGASAGYLTFVNALPFDKTSDGALALCIGGENGYCASVAAINEFYKTFPLDDGAEKAANELVNDNSKQPFFAYIKYMTFCVKGEITEAFRYLSKLNDSVSRLSDDEYSVIFPELIFVAGVSGNGEFFEKNAVLAESFFASCENFSPAILRAHLAYRRHMGEEEWVNAIERSYLNAEKELKGGFKLAEKNLYIYYKAAAKKI